MPRNNPFAMSPQQPGSYGDFSYGDAGYGGSARGGSQSPDEELNPATVAIMQGLGMSIPTRRPPKPSVAPQPGGSGHGGSGYGDFAAPDTALNPATVAIMQGLGMPIPTRRPPATQPNGDLRSPTLSNGLTSPDRSVRNGQGPSWLPSYVPASGDAVGAHSIANHKDLTPYTPPASPDEPRSYYTLGVRPLTDLPNRLYGMQLFPRPQHMEHMQFHGNDGNNFGMLKRDGFFKDGSVGADDPENLSSYAMLPQKYNARLIDAGREQVEKAWPAKRELALSSPQHLRTGLEPQRYHWLWNNCQDYINEVLEAAKQLQSPETGPLLQK